MKKRPKRIDLDKHKVDTNKDINSNSIAKVKYLEDIKEAHDNKLKSVKSIGSFFKKGATLFALFGSIILIGAIYDSFLTFSSMLESSTALAFLYLSLILIFVFILLASIVKNFIEYKKIKRIDRVQLIGDKLAKESSKEVYEYARNLINFYKSHENSHVANGAKKLERELDTILQNEVMDRVNELILYPLDKIASEKITKYASQTAISTAISPVAFIDAILIISRSHAMIKDVANVYGFRPNWLGELHLIKRVFGTLAFASATDILANHSSDFFGTSLLSKISIHSAQGIANGILVARIGLGVIRSTRPTNFGFKSSGFFKSIYKSIKKQLFSKSN